MEMRARPEFASREIILPNSEKMRLRNDKSILPLGIIDLYGIIILIRTPTNLDSTRENNQISNNSHTTGRIFEAIILIIYLIC